MVIIMAIPHKVSLVITDHNNNKCDRACHLRTQVNTGNINKCMLGSKILVGLSLHVTVYPK